jgi:hypothetical protein
MESITNPKVSAPTARQLASLKIVSRLLAHELHAQTTSKQISLSKDEVIEIQTCIDLYIEEATRRQGGGTASMTTPVNINALEPQLVGSRTN